VGHVCTATSAEEEKCHESGNVGRGARRAALADQYWVTYEGNDFPENEGWERYAYAGGAERYLQEGCLVLDGRASIDISDFYRQPLPADPGPGEVFLAQWRMRVDEVSGFFDPGVAVGSYGHGAVVLCYQQNRIYSLLEGVFIDFAPGVFHEYSLVSVDMLSYALYIDGALGRTGLFVGPMSQSQVDWGDYTQGASSLSDWDFFRFGVVPEPTTGLLFALGGLGAMLLRTRRTRRCCNAMVYVRAPLAAWSPRGPGRLLDFV
jgi:hypothetical protein